MLHARPARGGRGLARESAACDEYGMMVLTTAPVNRARLIRSICGLGLLRILLALSVCAQAASAQSRSVAITIDDLPAVSTRRDIAVHTSITERLLATLQREAVPAIGFVIEGGLETNGRPERERIALLERWLAAGMGLGNHSFSHRSLHQSALETYQQDVLRGERVIRPLVERHGKSLAWYRHPMLHTGRTMQTKQAFAAFLASHGYRIAPVTIDNQEWIFARAYDHTLDRNDSAGARRIAEAYLPYMDSIIGYYEQQSRALLGREPHQVLLLHANRLNAEYLDELLALMRRRGYRFISLDEAMLDPVYERADPYTGPAGITWLHRWAMAEGWRGSDFAGEPEVPAFVREIAGVS
jgi:peptidoglycan/xylan/chitin deacetylase (PgdA/CDA1 family)